MSSPPHRGGYTPPPRSTYSPPPPRTGYSPPKSGPRMSGPSTPSSRSGSSSAPPRRSVSPSTGNQKTLRMSVKEFLADRRAAYQETEQDVTVLMLADDPYITSLSSKSLLRKPTAYIWLPNVEHKNSWDNNHPECPQRCLSAHKRLDELGLISRLKVYDLIDYALPEKQVCSQYVTMAHDEIMIKNIQKLCLTNSEKECRDYDSIYYNGKASYTAAVDAVQAALLLTRAVAKGECLNGFANIRPPGHHATSDTPNGYCFFNNVAVCAKYLLDRKLAKKILIVDVDVHHGQGTQRCFYGDKNVLYFSIHRYENGTFWPNLRESDCDHIGIGAGTGFNINVPLNDIGLNDSDYMAIVLNILIPVAYEFGPDFVLVSAGYDACLGCPEGMMNVTPAFYGHLITMLSGLAKGKMLCVLEGGYCIETMAEAVTMTVRALLGDQCNPLDGFANLNPAVVNTINDVKFFLRKYWKCFEYVKTFPVENPFIYDRFNKHVVVTKYFGVPDTAPFPTKGYYPVLSTVVTGRLMNKFIDVKRRYHYNKLMVGYIYDESFLKHDTIGETSAPERPDRLKDIINKLNAFGFLRRMRQVPMLSHNEKYWIEKVHTKEYFNAILDCRIAETSDIYANRETPNACITSIRGILCLLDDIHAGKLSSGVALVRPPGHHAKAGEGRGFCHLNNVVIAANYLTLNHNLKRVAIIDFDIHHGDGTQSLTYNRKDIFYISVHRHDETKFFPNAKEADVNYLGTGKAFGLNINVPFNTTRKEKQANYDYLTVWTKIVLPLVYEYDPEFVLVSAGFDAGINDPLGYYAVMPETFGHMIQLLKPLGKIALCLEGGYNLETTSLSLTMCVKALLGDPLPMPVLSDLKPQTLEAIEKVNNVVKPIHPVLQVNKEISARKFAQDELEHFMLHKLKM